jgi:hypothetical protein
MKSVPNTSYTAAEVTRLTSVPYETLNHWAKIGLSVRAYVTRKVAAAAEYMPRNT